MEQLKNDAALYEVVCLRAIGKYYSQGNSSDPHEGDLLALYALEQRKLKGRGGLLGVTANSKLKEVKKALHRAIEKLLTDTIEPQEKHDLTKAVDLVDEATCAEDIGYAARIAEVATKRMRPKQ
ncbi:MAG: hypothetical protein ACOH13_12625 [Flavobacteriales bacterium]